MLFTLMGGNAFAARFGSFCVPVVETVEALIAARVDLDAFRGPIPPVRLRPDAARHRGESSPNAMASGEEGLGN